MKKISVIIPCYNVEYYIDRLFDCLVRQTMPLSDFEIILINDASTDNTLEKLIVWEEKYTDNIIIINFEENMGQGAARNAGLDIAGGEYIAFIDADDWVELNYLEAMYKLAVENDCDIVRFRCDRQYVYSRSEKEKPIKDKVNFYDLSDINDRKKYISDNISNYMVCGKLHRRSFVEKANLCFPCKVYHEDIYFAYPSYMYANKIAECEEALYHYYNNINGVMLGSSESEQFDRLAAFHMFYDLMVFDNLLDEYYAEIEMIFIRVYLSEVMDKMFRTFSEVDYYAYCAIRDWLMKKFPDCADNKYLNNENYNIERMFLQCIKNDLNELQLKAFRKIYLQKIYNINEPDKICSKRRSVTEFPQQYDMFDLLDKIIVEVRENKEITEDFNSLKCMVSCVPVTKNDDILSICYSNTDIMPAEIYRYYIGREFFISALKDKVRRAQEEEYKLDIYEKVLDVYSDLKSAN